MTEDRIEIVPIAIGTYSDPSLPALDQGDRTVNTEVRRLADLLAEFGGVLVDWDEPMAQRGADAINARLAEWTGSEYPHSILYWVGHAKAPGGRPVLQHAYSGDYAPGIDVQRFASAVTPRGRLDDDHWDVVIVDTCWSAEFVKRLSAEIDEAGGPRRVLLIGTSGDGQTNLGRFTDALTAVLRHNFGAVTEIPLWSLAGELRRAMNGAEVVPKEIMNSALRRAGAVSGIPLDVADEIRTVLANLDEDERRHFIPKAQAGELGELNWYFQGRTKETAAITRWLHDHDSGVLAVTGPAGSGKSALLGNLIVHTLPGLRNLLMKHQLVDPMPPHNRPPDNAFTIVVHLTGMSTQDVVTRLAEDLCLRGRPTDTLTVQLDWLLHEVEQTAPHTMLFDALDEAVDPLTVAGALLRRLGKLPQVRVIVGTRRDTHEGPDQPESHISDLLQALNIGNDNTVKVTKDAQAIAQYLVKRLTAAVASGHLIADVSEVAGVAAAIGAADREFLFARLVVHDILAEGHLPDSAVLNELVASDHRGLFRRALDRLDTKEPANKHIMRVLAHSQGRGIPVQDGILAVTAGLVAGTELNDSDVHALLDLAAPYVLIDIEHGQTVHRLAHRTFAEHFTVDITDGHEVHQAVIKMAVDEVASHHDAPNPYIRHYLSAHAAFLGESGWDQLAGNLDLLDQLDAESVSSEVMRSAFGRIALPSAIAGILAASHHLAQAAVTDRPGLRQLAMARHTAVHTNPCSRRDSASWHVRWAHLKTSPLHRALTGHAGAVFAMVAVPVADGRTLLATASGDETVRFWDAVTGTSVGDPLTGHTNGMTAMAAVPLADGRTLFATGGFDGTVRLWDPTTGTSMGDPLTSHTGWVSAVAAVPMADGSAVLAIGDSDGTVRLWDPATGTPVGDPLIGHTGEVTAMAAVPLADGRTLLASAGEDGTVRLWDAFAGTSGGAPLTGHTDWVSAMVVYIVNNRTLLATASNDGTVRLWDPATGTPVGDPLIGHTDDVTAVVLVPMPGGRTLLATASRDYVVRLWDPATGSPVGDPLTIDTNSVTAMAAVPMPGGPTLLATADADEDEDEDDRTVRLWDPATGTQVGDPLTGHTGSVTVVAAVPMLGGRTLLATADLVGTVRLWDPPTDTPTNDPLIGHTNSVTALVAVPLAGGRTLLATASRDYVVRLWDPATGSPVGDPLTIDTNSVTAMAAVPMPGGRTLLATADEDDGTVRLWDPVTGTPVGDPLTGHTGWVSALVAVPSADGATLLASASAGGTVRLWDPVTGISVGDPFDTHAGVPAMAAVLMPDDQALLAIGSGDGTVGLWDPATGTQVGEPFPGHTQSVEAVVSTTLEGGRPLLATASRDGTVRLWDPVTSTPLGHPLTGHTDWVTAVAPVPMANNRTLLASASHDGTVRLWDPTTHRQLVKYNLASRINDLVLFGPKHVILSMPDGIAAICFQSHELLDA